MQQPVVASTVAWIRDFLPALFSHALFQRECRCECHAVDLQPLTSALSACYSGVGWLNWLGVFLIAAVFVLGFAAGFLAGACCGGAAAGRCRRRRPAETSAHKHRAPLLNLRDALDTRAYG